jgi:hypothetical protein
VAILPHCAFRVWWRLLQNTGNFIDFSPHSPDEAAILSALAPIED